MRIIIAGHCAGLLAEAHGFWFLESRGAHDAAAVAASILPIVICHGQDGWMQWHGVALELLGALLGGLFGPCWAAESRVGQRRCTCGIKTAVLQAHEVGQWRQALRGSPFGETTVFDQWTCLGIRVASRAIGAAPPPRASASPRLSLQLPTHAVASVVCCERDWPRANAQCQLRSSLAPTQLHGMAT